MSREGSALPACPTTERSCAGGLQGRWLEPVAASALAMDGGYFTPANMPHGMVDLTGDGQLFVAIMRDLHCLDVDMPALSCHVAAVPLDVEVHKELRWDDLHFTGHLRRGDISFLPAGIAARTSYSGRYSEALHIFLRPSFLESLRDEEWERTPVTLCTRAILFRDAWLTELAARIRDEIVNERPGGRLMTQSLTTAFATSLVRMLNQADARPTLTIKSDSDAHRHFRRAIEFMHAHLDSDIGLSDLAEAAGCTVARLKFAFREHTGEPPYQHLLRIRVERARHLLIHSGSTIAEIAAECGFNGQSHFTNAFARMIGCTPAKWRRQHQ